MEQLTNKIIAWFTEIQW